MFLIKPQKFAGDPSERKALRMTALILSAQDGSPFLSAQDGSPFLSAQDGSPFLNAQDDKLLLKLVGWVERQRNPTTSLNN